MKTLLNNSMDWNETTSFQVPFPTFEKQRRYENTNSAKEKRMDMHLTRKIGSFGTLTTLLALSIGHSGALADIPGQHPHYLHARSDLRKADRLLNGNYEPNVASNLQAVDNEDHRAIWEIDRTAILDHKDINDNPPIDVSLKGAGRLHEVLRLLHSAHNDLTNYAENNSQDSGWRQRATYHVDKAIQYARRALHDRYNDDHDYF